MQKRVARLGGVGLGVALAAALTGGVASQEAIPATPAEASQAQKQDRTAKPEPIVQRVAARKSTRRERLYQQKHKTRLKIHPNRPWLH